MSGRYPVFDVSRVRLLPLARRQNDLVDFVRPLEFPDAEPHPSLREIAAAMLGARSVGANTLFLCGGHVLRAGVQRYLFDLMRHGLVQGIAVNGSVAIHDFETALQNATTESVAKYITEGQFGLWEETGRINDIVREGAAVGLGFGEALGKALAEGDYPHKEKSLFATAWQLGVPVTVHVGIGYDIVHAHPNCDGAALGAASYRDFLIFARLLDGLEHGVVCTFGSSVMAPEVFLKALSLARNVAKQEGRVLSHFASLVCDIQDIPPDARKEVAKSDPRYYFRPWKTLLSRTVADGGRSYYVRGRHEDTIPALWKALRQQEKA